MKKHIPNAITCCNLLCGAAAVVYAALGNEDTAFFFIICGAVFDFFDGMVARMLGVSSAIGKELDSLADVVTFGLAPCVIVWSWLHDQRILPDLWQASVFVMAAFSALRLAKFNLDTRQQNSFLGMPTPANALFWGSPITHLPYMSGYYWFSYVVLAGVYIASILLVSELPMFALKFKNFGWKGNEVRYVFLAASALILVLFKGGSIHYVILLYLGFSVALALIARIKKHI